MENTGDGTPPEKPKRKFYIERSVPGMTAPGDDRIEKLNQKQKTLHLEHTTAVLMTWPNWDIWPFKVSAPAVAFTAAIPGLILNSAFRNALLLGHYGRTSSYLVTMGLPTAVSALIHNASITSDILQQTTKCPVCLQVRSASLQLLIGFVYPLFLAPISSFPIAGAMKNSYFPKIHKQPREVLSFAFDVLKSVKNKYLAVGALQVVVAMGVTHLEQQCFMNTLLPILTGENVFNKETRKVEMFKD